MGVSISTLQCVGGGGALLLQAAEKGDARRVRQVLESRPEAAGVTGMVDRSSAMHRAAAGGHLDVMRTIVESLRSYGTSVTDPAKGDHKARSFASVERFLVEVINQRASRGQTPLMLACANGHLECVKYLLGEDADPFLVDRAHLRTALHCAAAYGHAPVLRALLADDLVVESAGERVPLRNARVRDMSGHCRYIDTRAEGGMTALHLAALSGTLACVQLLLEAGASMMGRTVVGARGSQQALTAGCTPLHAAAFRGDLGIVQAMLQAHADGMGRWNSGAAADGQRDWENDGRLDLRSVTSTTRQLPYHLARQMNHRHLLRILNPTVSIDAALEDCRDNESGFGPQRLSTLASYALRQGLLGFLRSIQAQKAEAAVLSATSDTPMEQLPASDAQSDPMFGQPGSKAEASKQQARIALPVAVSVAASATAAALHSAGSSPVNIMPILPRVRCSTDVVGQSLPPGTAGPVVNAQQSPVPQQHISPAGSENGSPSNKVSTSPQQHAIGPAPSAPSSAASPRSRHAHFALTLPARFGRVAHGGGAYGVVTPASAASNRPATAGSRKRRSSPGHLEARPQSAPLGPAMAAVAVSRAPPLAAATMPLPQRRLRTGSAGLALERPMSGSRMRTGQAMTAGRGGWRPQWRHEDFDEASSTAGSGDGGSDAAAVRRPSSSHGILRTISNLAQRIAHAEGAASRPASIMGFEERLSEPAECGICLDAMEGVAVNGCSHRLCVECALSLCELHKKPPLCPFCRLKIQGFHIVA